MSSYPDCSCPELRGHACEKVPARSCTAGACSTASGQCAIPMCRRNCITELRPQLLWPLPQRLRKQVCNALGGGIVPGGMCGSASLPVWLCSARSLQQSTCTWQYPAQHLCCFPFGGSAWTLGPRLLLRALVSKSLQVTATFPPSTCWSKHALCPHVRCCTDVQGRASMWACPACCTFTSPVFCARGLITLLCGIPPAPRRGRPHLNRASSLRCTCLAWPACMYLNTLTATWLACRTPHAQAQRSDGLIWHDLSDTTMREPHHAAP